MIDLGTLQQKQQEMSDQYNGLMEQQQKLAAQMQDLATQIAATAGAKEMLELLIALDAETKGR